jgi:hypothetical protein
MTDNIYEHNDIPCLEDVEVVERNYRYKWMGKKESINCTVVAEVACNITHFTFGVFEI